MTRRGTRVVVRWQHNGTAADAFWEIIESRRELEKITAGGELGYMTASAVVGRRTAEPSEM